MRWFRKLARTSGSTRAELAAFLIAAVVVGHFCGVWWALVPVAVYLFLLSLALDRGKR